MLCRQITALQELPRLNIVPRLRDRKAVGGDARRELLSVGLTRRRMRPRRLDWTPSEKKLKCPSRSIKPPFPSTPDGWRHYPQFSTRRPPTPQRARSTPSCSSRRASIRTCYRWRVRSRLRVATPFADQHAFPGAEPTSLEDKASSFDDLKGLIAKTLEVVKGVDAKKMEGAEDRDITFPAGDRKMTLKGATISCTFPCRTSIFTSRPPTTYFVTMGLGSGRTISWVRDSRLARRDQLEAFAVEP